MVLFTSLLYRRMPVDAWIPPSRPCRSVLTRRAREEGGSAHDFGRSNTSSPAGRFRFAGAPGRSEQRDDAVLARVQPGYRRDRTRPPTHRQPHRSAPCPRGRRHHHLRHALRVRYPQPHIPLHVPGDGPESLHTLAAPQRTAALGDAGRRSHLVRGRRSPVLGYRGRFLDPVGREVPGLPGEL